MKMETIYELRTARGTALDQAAALVANAENEKRNLTDDESKQYAGHMKTANELADRIKRAEEVFAAKAASARDIDPAESAMNGGIPKVNPLTGRRLVFPRQMRGFAATQEGREAAFKSGMWLLATVFNKPAAKQWCVENGMPMVVEKAGQAEGDNTAGGFLVPQEFESAIIDLREMYGVARQIANVKPMGRDSLVIPVRLTGLTAYAVAEGVSITESEKTWGQVALSAKKWAVLTRYSTELDEDAVISIASDLAGEIAYAFASAEDDAFFNGDGTSTYHGIVGVRPAIIDGTHTAGAKDAASNHDTFAEIDATDLATMMAALPQYALPNAKFICSQPAFSLVFSRLVGAAGGQTTDTLAGAIQPRYLGYPIVISQKMPTSTGDLSDVSMILFGDMSLSSVMGDRRGVTVRSSEHVYFATDQIAIRGTERMDIVHHSLGDTTTAGPVVALIGE